MYRVKLLKRQITSLRKMVDAVTNNGRCSGTFLFNRSGATFIYERDVNASPSRSQVSAPGRADGTSLLRTPSEAAIVVYTFRKGGLSPHRPIQYVGHHNRLCYGACR